MPVVLLTGSGVGFAQAKTLVTEILLKWMGHQIWETSTHICTTCETDPQIALPSCMCS